MIAQGVFSSLMMQLDVRSLRPDEPSSSLEHMETDIFVLGAPLGSLTIMGATLQCPYKYVVTL